MGEQRRCVVFNDFVAHQLLCAGPPSHAVAAFAAKVTHFLYSGHTRD